MASRDREFKLPADARARLAAPIREAVNSPSTLRSSHSVPVRRQLWSARGQAIRDQVAEFGQELVVGPDPHDFRGLRTWFDNLLEMRNGILSATLALAPFECFDDQGGRRMLGMVDVFLLKASDELGSPGDVLVDASLIASTDWLTNVNESDDDVVARAFKVDAEHARDEAGHFSPSRVLAFYYHRGGALLQVVLPHLASLGLPNVNDLLVAVSAIGWIADADDSVAAYSSMDALINAIASAHGSQVLEASLQYLHSNESALRQGRVRINRAVDSVRSAESDEDRHLHLADLYKRLVEGPFRRYSWVFHSLNTGRWSQPPMLTQLRDTLVAGGGWLGKLTDKVVLRDIRNGEAHESLFWDGVLEKFVAEGIEVGAPEVAYAATLADAFARGCESAIACYSALGAEHTPGPPREKDRGRLEPWRRAEAFFGTNGIRMIRADFNAKVARIVCVELRQDNINPCFQALLLCHGLLPHVERFEVLTASSSEPAISASKEALSLTRPVWELALQSFTAMPLSTFLPTNFDARIGHEDMRRATRSVAWIAVDDFLDAFDSSVERWGEEDATLFSKRVALNILATKQCLRLVPTEAQMRLRLVHQQAKEMAAWLQRAPSPLVWRDLNRTEPVARFRLWWDAWGPVERLPTITKAAGISPDEDFRPYLRDEPGDLRWRII